MSAISTLNQLGQREAVSMAAIALAALAIAHGAVALGRTRQWYMVPVIGGVTGLLGFLLNPLADASTLHDLKATLTSYDTLTLVCIIQFVLVAASAWLGLGLESSPRRDRRALGLAVVSVIPAPALAVVMLFWEQIALSSAASARPETVGREVGLMVATAIGAACGLTMCLPPRLLAVLHQFLSLALLMACMFVPFLQDRLPQPMAVVDWNSLRLFAWFVPLLIMILGVGFAWRGAYEPERLVSSTSPPRSTNPPCPASQHA